MEHFLAFIWLGIIGFAIIMYVILDGFDLGTGILSIFIDNEHQRDLMISTIMPVWDGNQTWLVLGGATLYGAFPLAFSTILPILYMPILVMVAALLFRGVVFEFRLKANRSKRLWEWAFFIGSFMTALAQGMMLGGFVQGFHANNGNYQWITPFSFTCGIALVFGYSLLASNWLIAKTEGDLQQKCYRSAKICLIVIAFFATVISLWSPLVDPDISARWFNPELIGYLAVLPAVTALLFFLHWMALKMQKEFSPFWLAIGIFVLCYIGFVISVWPYIVPRSITYTDAAAPETSLLFMLVGTLIMLPVLLYYTYHSYRIFRGKVKDVIKY